MTMSIEAGKEPQREVIPLNSAVFCLDCKVISSSRDDECSACHGHSLLSLSRILGGSLRDRKPEEGKRGPFDITLTISIGEMQAKDVNTTLEGLTNAIAPRLAEGRASFHINVQPRVASPRKAA